MKKNARAVNWWSITILKATLVTLGFAVLAICMFVLPSGIASELKGDFDYGPIMLGMYVSAVPFFFALFHAFRLLNLIRRNEAFSLLSVEALKRIKLCAFIVSGLYAAGMPYIFYVADRDDAPGVAAIGFIIVGASFVVAMAAAVFQQLIQNAVDIKSENDLTV